MVYQEYLSMISKFDQVSRLYSRLYSERTDIYASVLKRRWFWREKPSHHYARLKVINSREQHIVSSLKKHQHITENLIEQAQSLKESHHALQVIKSYFDEFLSKQESFLETESAWLEGSKESGDLQTSMQEYVHSMQEFEEKMKHEAHHFSNPTKIFESVKNNSRNYPKEFVELFGPTGLFVVYFTGMNIAWGGIKTGSISVDNIPSADLMLQWTVVATILIILNVSAKTWEPIKKLGDKLHGNYLKLPLPAVLK